MSGSEGGAAPAASISEPPTTSGDEEASLEQQLAGRTADLKQATVLLNDMERRFNQLQDTTAAAKGRNEELGSTVESLRECSRGGAAQGTQHTRTRFQTMIHREASD